MGIDYVIGVVMRRLLSVAGRLGCAIALLLGFPSMADAHLVTTGLGPVYDGIGHLLLTPQDLIAVVALCLLAGLRGAAHSRSVLFLLPLVWFAAGSMVGSWFEGFGSFPFAAVSFIVLGLLVAADLRINSLAVGVLSVLLGTIHGLNNGVAMRVAGGTLGLLGITAALFVVVAITSAMVVSQKKPWTKIVIRVLGSWAVATGIMMLGWHYRPEKKRAGDADTSRLIASADGRPIGISKSVRLVGPQSNGFGASTRDSSRPCLVRYQPLSISGRYGRDSLHWEASQASYSAMFSRKP